MPSRDIEPVEKPVADKINLWQYKVDRHGPDCHTPYTEFVVSDGSYPKFPDGTNVPNALGNDKFLRGERSWQYRINMDDSDLSAMAMELQPAFLAFVAAHPEILWLKIFDDFVAELALRWKEYADTPTPEPKEDVLNEEAPVQVFRSGHGGGMPDLHDLLPDPQG